MSNMRGLDTQVRAIRRRVFKEVAKLGFEANSEGKEELRHLQVTGQMHG